jgi:hypothetical protein
MKVIITENQFDNVLKKYERVLNNLKFYGVKKITLDYRDPEAIEVNIFYDLKLAIELGQDFNTVQWKTNRNIFNVVEKINLGPKYLYYLHYE